MKYVVIKSHVSEFPNPIRLKAGDRFSVGEMYEGPESWANWYLCSAPGQEPGWVPGENLQSGAGFGGGTSR